MAVGRVKKLLGGVIIIALVAFVTKEGLSRLHEFGGFSLPSFTLDTTPVEASELRNSAGSSSLKSMLKQLTQFEERILALEGQPASKSLEQPAARRLSQADVIKRGGGVSNQEYQQMKLSFEARIEALEQALDNSEELIAKLRESSTKKSDTKSDARLETAQAEAKQYKAEARKLKAQVTSLQEQLSDAQQISEANVGEVEEAFIAKLHKLSAKNKQLVAEKEEYDGMVDELRGIMKQQREVEKGLRKKLHLAQEELMLAKQDSVTVASQRKQIQQLKESNSALSEQLNLSKTNIGELESAVEQRKGIELDNSYLRSEIATLKGQIAMLREEVSDMDKMRSQSEAAAEKIASLGRERDSLEKKYKQLSNEIDKGAEEQLRLAKKVKELEQAAEVKETEMLDLNRQLSKQIGDSRECSIELANSREEAARLRNTEKSLVKAKNELLLRDTELQTLRSTPSIYKKPKKPAATARARLAEPQVNTDPTEVLIAEVVARKANLRSGPGTEHSPVMQVKKGSRLTVESVHGEWYRVVSPTGSRAFIRQDVVRVNGNGWSGGETSSARSASRAPTPRAKPRYDEETMAFESLRKAIQGQ